MFSLRPYAPPDVARWDALVARSRTGNLLHRRGYMDYHADRFTDRRSSSSAQGEPVAVFPANSKAGVVTSHGGLTYAGLISTAALRAESTLALFKQMAAHYRAPAWPGDLQGGATVFHAYPAEEDLYALHRWARTGAARSLLGDRAARGLPFLAERRRDIRHAREAGVRMQTGGERLRSTPC